MSKAGRTAMAALLFACTGVAACAAYRAPASAGELTDQTMITEGELDAQNEASSPASWAQRVSEELVCRTETVFGSRAMRRTICMSPREAEQAREVLRRTQESGATQAGGETLCQGLGDARTGC